MNILITGASGLLGSAIRNVAEQTGAIASSLQRDIIWNSSADDLARLMRDFDLVIHAAANTNVEQCELDPVTSHNDNVRLTEILAEAVRRASVKLVFISSTGVYGAEKNLPYTERDHCSPTTVHHRGKYEAEQLVLQANPSNLVIRTGWLFGGEAINRKNFVARRIEEAISAKAEGRVLKSNAQQFGVPSYCDDVALRILMLARGSARGVFNCVNSGHASRFDYVKAIVDAAAIPVSIEAVNAQDFNRKAPVSNNEMAENWQMAQLGLPPMPAWQDSLTAYVKKLILEMGYKSGRS